MIGHGMHISRLKQRSCESHSSFLRRTPVLCSSAAVLLSAAYLQPAFALQGWVEAPAGAQIQSSVHLASLRLVSKVAPSWPCSNGLGYLRLLSSQRNST